METIEGNRLIAEFMGFKIKEMPEPVGKYWAAEGEWKPRSPGGMSADRELPYHSSWDWLIPVVERICDLCEGGKRELNDKGGIVCTTQICCSIETVWSKVVDFIQWYNTTKPQPNATK